MSITPQITSYIQNGTRVDIQKVQMLLGTGVQQPPMCLYNVIPAAPNNTYVAAAQGVLANTPLTLTTANSITFLGQYPVVVLDCQRGLSITFAANTTSNTTVTWTGYDDRNIPVTSTATFNSGTVGGTYPLANGGTVNQLKCCSMVSSVTFTADPGVQVSIGTGLTIGLPYFCPNRQYIQSLSWNGGWGIMTNTGTVASVLWNPLQSLIFTTGYQFNPVSGAGAVAPPSATTRDARGFVDLGNATAALNPPNGSRLLSVFYYVYGADSYLQAQLTNALPSAITQTGITTTTLNRLQMLAQDEVGLQFPGGV